MIHFVSGNMFDRPVDIRVNTVNCVGVMGAGVALAFKQRYPEMFKDYERACRSSHVRPGHMHVWKPLDGDWIINFPTKRDWRDPSRYEDIEAGLDDLRAYLSDLGPVSVAVPALGCGHGGLDWGRVRPMIAEKLGELPGEVWVYEPASSRQIGDQASIVKDDDLKIANELGFTQKTISAPGEGNPLVDAFIRGSCENLGAKWIALLPSKDPSPRELAALSMIAREVSARAPGSTVALIYSARSTEDVAKVWLSAGVHVALILPFGLATRKSATSFVSSVDRNLCSISLLGPRVKWSREALGKSMAFLRSGASALLVSDPEPDWLAERFLKAWPQRRANVRYDRTSSGGQMALLRAGFTPVARSSETGTPNIDPLITDGLSHGVVVSAEPQKGSVRMTSMNRGRSRVSVKLVGVPEDRLDELIRMLDGSGAEVTEISAD